MWPGFIKGATYNWVRTVYEALRDINSRYPFLAYGYDWLAFAHLVIAVAFAGVLRMFVWCRRVGAVADLL